MYQKYKNAKKNFWHPMGPAGQEQTLIISKGDGNYIEDIDGNKLLDGISGLWNVNIGHNRAEVKEAISKQMDELAYYQMFDGIAHPRVFDLADRLVNMFAQENMSKVMFNSGGSDAVETALKMSRQYWIAKGEPQRIKFMSLRNAYHGVHVGGTSVGGNNVYHLNHGPLLPNCVMLDSPWLYRNPWNCDDPKTLTDHCIRQLEDQIAYQGPETIAAFIAEPVQGAGGVIVPPEDYWPRVREVLSKHNILMISDEVVTGFGRSGDMLGSRGWGVKPDILCLAKAITAGYIPLGATVFNEEIANTIEAGEGFRQVIMHGYTYSGHPTACAAALSVLDIVERENLPQNAAEVGAYLNQSLQSLSEEFEVVGEVRGKGLMLALDLVTDKASRTPINPMDGYANRVAATAKEHGVMIRPVGTKIILSPPLTLNREEADLIVFSLRKAFTENRP